MSENDIIRDLISAREEYIELIKADLLGPGSEFTVPDKEHELISDSPTRRYSVGILYPQGSRADDDNEETASRSADEDAEYEDDDDAGEEEDETAGEDDKAEAEEPFEEKQENDFIAEGNSDKAEGDSYESLDEEINMATQYMPSSMGFTFLVSGDCNTVNVSARFGTYRRATVSDCMVPFNPEKKDDGENQEEKKEHEEQKETKNHIVPADLADIVEYDGKQSVLKLRRPVRRKEVRDIFERDTIPEVEVLSWKKCMYKLADFCTIGYVREPHEEEMKIVFSDGDHAECEVNCEPSETKAKIVAQRKKIPKSEHDWSVTVMLVNDRAESRPHAKHCIFQACVEVDSKKNDFVFIDNDPNVDLTDADDEERSLNLLYRNKKNYGTGLGTSVNWDVDENGNGRVWNDFFPQVEVPSVDFSLPENTLITNEELSMKYLSDLSDFSKEEKLNSMENLVTLYQNWIDDLKVTAERLDEKFVSPAAKNIAECEMARERMMRGIETLRNDDTAYDAFMLANRAMFMQRVHIEKQNEMAKENAIRYPGDEQISEWLQELNYFSEPDSGRRWRPFQIAFILMDINSIVREDSDERNLVDLIWFPTGGGKTEAYLGLTAFTIFYRRMAHPKESSGTAVIMRYTLRLLTAQQFTRASTLICACEYIRRDCATKNARYPRYSLGKDPITIGLWIGGEHTPNNNSNGKDNARYFLDRLRKGSGSEVKKFNKFQVLKCPWCGTELTKEFSGNESFGEWGYKMKDGIHFYMHCTHEDCDFMECLPIQVVDEELYRKPPSLLFGTVDKFAMLPWEGRANAFFGEKGNRPPELIIQDELHLISGALGTLVGLYETAVDAMCSENGNKPKIIASTATIRRAKEQCCMLYNRDVAQFPPPGLDAGDSFFSRESTDGVFGRIYVGVMPSGKTKVMSESRMMGSLLQRASMMDLPDDRLDKLWTLTVYFNSRKDLGKASNLVDDQVNEIIKQTANRLFAKRRLISGSDELTGRVSTIELNETLEKLEKIEHSKENVNAKRYASNVLLATNMISVGIDVARLNVMLMVGQPKLTSEYIQASSRIGRSYPGVVFVLYDSTKSRDRSHYERFRSYHESFYRFVEPMGATPFSKPARERALHAVLVAMMRNKKGWTKDNDAENFNAETAKDSVHDIESYVLERVNGINVRNAGAADIDTGAVREEMDVFFEKWDNMVQTNKTDKIKFRFGKSFMYLTPKKGKESRLMKPFDASSVDNGDVFLTLTSMRDVDREIKGRVLIWGDD